MTADLIFYTNPHSRGQIARWMLEETGAEYETVALGYADTMKAAPYLAINPMGKVPAIVHRGRVVTECAAICAYLAETFPQADLAPRPEERADYYRWLFFVAGPVEAAVSNHAVGFDPTPERQRMFGYGTFERTVDTLERAVSAHPYIAGSRFTAADVYVGSHIGWGMMFGTLPKRAAFQDYFDRVSARDACARARAKDEALAAELETAA